MAEATAEFFEALADQGHQPVLGRVRGRVRFDLVDGQATDQWLVAIDRGDLTVSHAGGEADCAIHLEKAFFERLIHGEENAVAGVLRGAIVCSGDVELLMAIQRVFPGPPDQVGSAAQRRSSR